MESGGIQTGHPIEDTINRKRETHRWQPVRIKERVGKLKKYDMTNMREDQARLGTPGTIIFQKPILTRSEAAAMLGVCPHTLRSYDLPRYVKNSRVHFYLLDDLVEWVRQLPREGEMPHDQLLKYTPQVVVV